jgi:hypothetical protein
MIRQAALRRLSLWLVGLFLVAQSCGVVHLLDEHTTHVAAVAVALSADHVGTAKVPQKHHRGDADGAVQHHELQDLNGVPSCLSSSCDLGYVHAAARAYVPIALTASDPVRLERPPKPSLSI